MNSASRVDTPKSRANIGSTTNTESQVWVEQIKSEQLYNTLCRKSQKGTNGGGSFATSQASESGSRQPTIEVIPIEEIFNQSQGPEMIQRVQETMSRLGNMTMPHGSTSGFNLAADPEIMSISSQSSFDDPYNMRDRSRPFGDGFYSFKQSNTHGLDFGHQGQFKAQKPKKSRKRMMEEIDKLKLELLACREKLDQTNKKNVQLEKLVQKQNSVEKLKSKRTEKSIQTSVLPVTAIDVTSNDKSIISQKVSLKNTLFDTETLENCPNSASSIQAINPLDTVFDFDIDTKQQSHINMPDKDSSVKPEEKVSNSKAQKTIAKISTEEEKEAEVDKNLMSQRQMNATG